LLKEVITKITEYKISEGQRRNIFVKMGVGNVICVEE